MVGNRTHMDDACVMHGDNTLASSDVTRTQVDGRRHAVCSTSIRVLQDGIGLIVATALTMPHPPIHAKLGSNRPLGVGEVTR